MSHTQVWIPTHPRAEPGDGAVWLARLRTAWEYETFVGAAERDGLARVVQTAE
jgi:hypothetical protein